MASSNLFKKILVRPMDVQVDELVGCNANAFL